MKQLTKWLSVLLLATLLLSSVLVFTACDGDSTEPTTTTPAADGPSDPADPSDPTNPSTPPANTNPTYTVKIIDEAGNPVSGAKIQFCTDSGCSPIVTASGADGIITVTNKPANEYKVQLRFVPEGFVMDTDYRAFNEDNHVEIVLIAAQ